MAGQKDRPEAPWAARTVAAQAHGRNSAPVMAAVVPPIAVATTFIRDPDNQYRSGFAYGRPDNPTVRDAEAVVANLEGAAAAMIFGSGMSAATAVFSALSPGDHIIAPSVMYWALRQWLCTDARHWGLEVDLVDTTDLACVRAAIRREQTKLIWLETP